jgi:hypothetical protein
MLQSNGAAFQSERQKNMTSTYVLTSGDIVGLLVILAVVFAPLVFVLCCGRNLKPSLPECPYCGAQYRGTPARCYCCGYEFILPESNAGDVKVIQLVRQADSNKATQPTAAHSPPASKVA